MFATGSKVRTTLILSATTAAAILILVTIEAHIVITGHLMPAAVRHWLMWGSLLLMLGSLAAYQAATNHARTVRLERMEATQTEIVRRLDRIDTILDPDNIQHLVRAELGQTLTTADLTDAMQRVMGPALEAVYDYRAIQDQMATVTRIPHRTN